MSTDTPAPDEDLLGQPARVDLEDDELGAGRIADVETVGSPPHEQTRVIVENPDGAKNVPLEAVTIVDERDRLLDAVRAECGPPDAGGHPNTLASHSAVLGVCQRRLDLALRELEATMRAAIIAEELVCVRYDEASGQFAVGPNAPREWTRYYCPKTERALRRVVGEQNRRDDPDQTLIEHCALAIEEVCGDE